MTDYSQGKIYQIVSAQTDKIYIGSTCQRLRERLGDHMSKYRAWQAGKLAENIASYEILQYDDSEIHLVEMYPCQQKRELLKREQYYIDQFREAAVNKHSACLSKKEWRARNKLHITKHDAEYRAKNKAKIKAHQSSPEYLARRRYREQLYRMQRKIDIFKNQQVFNFTHRTFDIDIDIIV